MPKVIHKSINLIPKDEFESSVMGRILRWALSTFRIMVIVTELIVMSAFLSRFWLDSRNSDLNEEVQINTMQVAAYQDIEKALKSYQARLSNAKELFQKTNKSLVIKEISSLLPLDVFLSSIDIKDDNKVTLKANSLSDKSIVQLTANLVLSNKFDSINLVQVSSNPENVNITTFTLTANYKKGIN